MAKAGVSRRPTRIMQEAVNLFLQGDKDAAVKKLKEEDHPQHTRENLERFATIRKEKHGGGPYTFERKKRGAGRPPGAKAGRRGRPPKAAATAAVETDIFTLIDGRTKLSTLIRLESRIEQLLSGKDQKEVAKVREAMKNVEKLRKQLEEAESLIT